MKEAPEPRQGGPRVRGRRRGIVAGFVLLALAFVAVLLVGQARALGEVRGDLIAFDWDVRPARLLVALALATANLYLMGAVWVCLFRAAGGRIGLGDGVRAWMTTNLGRYIPGKIWQLTGLTVYVRGRGESGAAALAATLAFQVLSLGTGAALAAATLGRRLAALPGGEVGVVGLVLVLLLAVLHPGILGRLTGLAARWLREEAPVARIGARALGKAAAGLLLAWLVYGLGLHELLAGLSAQAEIGWHVLAGFFAASYVAGYLVLLTPGGLVVREGVLSWLLTAFTPLTLGVAGAVAIVARVWIVLSELVAVGLAAALHGARPEAHGREGEVV